MSADTAPVLPAPVEARGGGGPRGAIGVDGPEVVAPRLRGRWLLGAVVGLALACLWGLASGAASLGLRDALAVLVDQLPLVDVDHGLTASQEALLLQVRAPRVALGALVGAALASSGAAYQGVFRNPLADPYLLGIAAGAGTAATLVIVLRGGDGALAGLAAVGIPLAAFGGGLVAVSLTWLLGRTVGGRSSVALILAGVAVAAFFAAITQFLMMLNSESLVEVYGFLVGRLLTAGWSDVVALGPWLLVSTGVLLLHRRQLDALSVGEDEAASLGVDVTRVRATVVLAATAATAAAVAVAGLVGWVGIAVPHTVRLLTGTSHRSLLPLSWLGGAAFLVAADVVARSLLSPVEIPIGVVTAFVGAPFFVAILRRSRRAAA